MEILKSIIGVFKKESKPEPMVYIKKDNNYYTYFEVAGAGKIQIGKNCLSRTGRSFGFSFGVEWGRFGYAGGVLDREDAKKLAEHILSEYAKITPEQREKEQTYLKQRDEDLKNFNRK